MRPDYEKEGTGLFSDDEEDGGKGRYGHVEDRMRSVRKQRQPRCWSSVSGSRANAAEVKQTHFSIFPCVRHRSDDDTPRMQTGRGRARRLSGEDKSLSPVRKPKDTSPPRRQAHKSPPRRQTSSSKAAHSASKDAVSTRKSTGSR